MLTLVTDLKEIHELALGIPLPESYYVGVDPSLKELPHNVLLFHRRREALGQAVNYHHRFVLMACLREQAGVILDGELLQVSPGQGVVIFPFQSHYFTRFADLNNASWLVTTFEFEDRQSLSPLKNTPFTYEERDSKRLGNLTKAYLAWTEGDHERGREVPIELLLLLSGLLQRQQRYVQRAGGHSLAELPNHEMLQRLSNFVYENLHRHIGIDEMASLASLSPSRLRARFKESLGVSIGRFIRRTRIHRACGLLHSTDQTVSEIAEACGFDSVFSFSRAFKQVVGRSPRAFREHVRGGPSNDGA